MTPGKRDERGFVWTPYAAEALRAVGMHEAIIQQFAAKWQRIRDHEIGTPCDRADWSCWDCGLHGNCWEFLDTYRFHYGHGPRRVAE